MFTPGTLYRGLYIPGGAPEGTLPLPTKDASVYWNVIDPSEPQFTRAYDGPFPLGFSINRILTGGASGSFTIQSAAAMDAISYSTLVVGVRIGHNDGPITSIENSIRGGISFGSPSFEPNAANPDPDPLHIFEFTPTGSGTKTITWYAFHTIPVGLGCRFEFIGYVP